MMHQITVWCRGSGQCRTCCRDFLDSMVFSPSLFKTSGMRTCGLSLMSLEVVPHCTCCCQFTRSLVIIWDVSRFKRSQLERLSDRGALGRKNQEQRNRCSQGCQCDHARAAEVRSKRETCQFIYSDFFVQLVSALHCATHFEGQKSSLQHCFCA